MLIRGFDWDHGNREKCQRHGLSIEDVERVFTGDPWVRANTRHRSNEDRFQAVGITGQHRYAFVVFTFRESPEGLKIRPISARYMHQREIEHYERQTKG